MSNKCLQCKVRGDCCYVNIPIEGYNVILDNVHCPKLDTKTGLCTTYENRHVNSWCLDDNEMFEKGCLPKGCEYLKDGKNEQNPKIHLGDILNNIKIPEDIKKRAWTEFHNFDRMPFEMFIQVLHKKEEVKT